VHPSRSRRRVRLALGTVAIAATLAGCTSAESGLGSLAPSSSRSAGRGAPTSGSQPTQAKARFSDCSKQFNLGALNFPPGREQRLSFECAAIDVPLDYAAPGGRKVSLQLVRVHDSTNKSHANSLLVNPGGPGGSGVELALGLSARVPDRLLAKFDLVGFDPRGVGSSTPIRCLSDAEKDAVNAASPDVRTPTGFAAAKAQAAKVAKACSAKYGKALAQFDTVQTAKDMAQIRQAVGDARMNYLGFSYGTELGAQYAHLFPHTIGVMVLDGAVNPLTSDITAFADQLRGFEGSFDQFANWCKVHSPCKTLGDPREAVYNVAAQAMKSPIPSSQPGETRKATSSLVYTGVLSALYSKSQWPTLGEGLIGARGGDSQYLLQLADDYNQRYNGKYSNIADANNTINCNDSKPGPSDATVRATTTSWVKRFPMFGLWSAASLFACQQWQPDRTVPPLPSATGSAATVLVVGNLNDPATPYQGAKDLTKTLGKARLLTWDGEGHTSFLQGSACIDGLVEAYLISRTLPAPGKTCPR